MPAAGACCILPYAPLHNHTRTRTHKVQPHKTHTQQEAACTCPSRARAHWRWACLYCAVLCAPLLAVDTCACACEQHTQMAQPVQQKAFLPILGHLIAWLRTARKIKTIRRNQKTHCVHRNRRASRTLCLSSSTERTRPNQGTGAIMFSTVQQVWHVQADPAS